MPTFQTVSKWLGNDTLPFRDAPLSLADDDAKGDALQKVIGLIGGVSWDSSSEYYPIINHRVRTRLGGLHSARCLPWSFDFSVIEALQHAGCWCSFT